MDLITFLIKCFLISGYDPTEDLIEGGMGFLSNPIRSLIKKYRESVDVQLKKENFTDEQIKTVKKVLAESNYRFITNSAASIYENNADAMQISRKIFMSFKEANESREVSSQTKICLTDETENEKIIKGIAIIIGKAVALSLTSPEYNEYLTKEVKKTKRIAADNKKVLDDHDIQLDDHSVRINNLEQAGTLSAGSLKRRINEYRKYVYGLYEKRNIGNTLLGEESLAELYMQPFYYKTEDETSDVEQLFEEFILKEDCGVLWITGEPGHGKTSMCIKAVADYRSRKRYQQARGVFWFRLNPQGISEMVKHKMLALEKVFTWGRITGNRCNMIEPREIEGSLVFLDGFDELKTSLEEHGISSNQFYEQVNQLALEYKMHIVVTSRTRALEQDEFHTESQLRRGDVKIICNLSDGGVLKNNVMLLSPLTEEKQAAWINELISLRENKGIDTSDLRNYKHTFQALQKNEDITGLLKVPILLRMIVQNCFEPSSDNRIELYRELFDKTLLRQGLRDQRERLHSIYREIAFRIFVFDDDCAEINKADFIEIMNSDAFLYQYYLHTPEVELRQDKADIYRITFIHRSFYQYFLSEFFYEKLKAVTDDQSGENFLKYLWPRHMDSYVMDNLCLIAKDEDIDYTHILKSIDEKDAILTEHESLYGSRESIGNYDKANNVFWNTISVWNSIFNIKTPQKKMDLTGRVIELMSKYNCDGILLRNSYLSGTNLSVANLCRADLSGADLSKADLMFANLSDANLREANLREAKLYGTNLFGADLSKADLLATNLIEADLRGANLFGADLSNADLFGACLREANLFGANLRKADLSESDLREADLCEAKLDDNNMFGIDMRKSIVSKNLYNYISEQNVKGFDEIIWVDEE